MTRLPLNLAAAALLPLALAAVPAAHAAEPAAEPRIVVTGEGETAVSPDMAVVTLSVVREAETARAALDANNEAMRAVIAAMKEEGVAARDLQTAGLSIQPRQVYPENGEGRPRIVGYTVSNTLTVRVREIGNTGAILDRAVTLGVNQGGNIAFLNADPSAALTTARQRAVEDAIARARTLAEAAGASVGPILSMREHQGQDGPRPMEVRAMRMDAAGAAPVEAGETTYRVEVEVTFGLEQ